ncbi:nucleotidyltransferase family protein [Rhodoferax aquaticus]
MPTVIVLASGRGARFAASGGTVHKLKARLGGVSVLDRTLAAVRGSGLPWLLEQSGLPGMGDTIAAGIRATRDAHGWLVLPGDLPLVQAETLRFVAAALVHHAVVVPVYRGQRGHPVGFAPSCREQLLGLQGDQGAAGVVRAHPAIELVVNDAGVSFDIDTLKDLERAEIALALSGTLL